MKIYISHSRNFNYQRDLYEPLKNSSLAQEHEFIFPHIDSEKPFESKKTFEANECQLIIAEVSLPSTGQGIELGWANMKQLPIIALHNSQAKISGSLAGLCKKIIPYKNTIAEIIDELKQAINEGTDRGE